MQFTVLANFVENKCELVQLSAFLIFARISMRKEVALVSNLSDFFKSLFCGSSTFVC